MTSPETMYTKNVANKHRFLLVTRTTCFDIRFGRYRILKSGFSAGQNGIQVLGQDFGPEHGSNSLGLEY
jgi:hypothetical protein